MARTPANKRPKKHAPQLALKKGTEWSDLIALSLQPDKKPAKKAPKKKAKPK